VYGVRCKGVLVPHLVLERIEAQEKSDSECGARTQAGPRGQIGYVLDLDALIDLHELEAGAHRRMLDQLVVDDIFNF
jgi:hypothetical protein